jgi:hypothetical protein
LNAVRLLSKEHILATDLAVNASNQNAYLLYVSNSIHDSSSAQASTHHLVPHQ